MRKVFAAEMRVRGSLHGLCLTAVLLVAAAAPSPPAFAEKIRNHFDADSMMRAPGFFDLVVLGARGLGGIRRLLLGSVSEAVLTHATCSVLIVRAA